MRNALPKTSPARLGAAALTALAAAFLIPSAAFAAGPQPGSLPGPEAFAACLDGQAPTTQNVAPGAYQGANLLAPTVLDTDPTKDQVVLDFADGIADDEAKSWAASHGLGVRLNSVYSDEANVYVADVAEGAVPYVLDCLTKQDAEGRIEGIEENIEYQMLGAPNDPLYQFQWNFDQVNAEGAWGVSTGKDVTVAVIDTGVALEDDPGRNIKAARDLGGTANVKGYDFVDDDDFAWDGHGHGTHVAGTIAQTTNNKYGVAGLAYDAKIMPLRVLNSRGFGQVADIADSIRFAADNGAQVINMSLGGPLPSLVMKRAISHAHKKGVTVVAAAGNGGKRAPSYPAAYDHVIAVAATQFDKTTTFYSQWGSFVDIAAPGGNTRVDQNGDDRPDGVMQETLKDGNTNQHDFLLYMGTSMASPHVAAGAALVIAQGVTHPDRVEEILTGATDDSQRDRFDEKEYRERYGAGIMQADKAAKDAATHQGGWRFAGALLLSLLALTGVRRKDVLGIAPKAGPLVVGTAVVTGAGLFFLPFLVGDLGLASGVVGALSRPLAELDATLLGFGWHQTPVMASALLPLLALGLFGGHRTGRFVAAGLALGMAGFCLTEAFLLTSDVLWIPGMDLLDRGWLAANGLLSFALGYLALKRY